MRLVAALVAGLALGGPVLAQLVEPPQVVFSGAAEGTQGERVSVVILLTQRGETVSTTATWDPPLATGSTKASPEDPYPALSFHYLSPSAAGPGQPSDASVLVMAFAPPGSRSHANPAKQLDGLMVEASNDGGAVQTLSLKAKPGIADLPMTAERFADLPAPAAGTMLITLRLVDKQHRQRATARYDLSQTASRDALFAQAWSEALKASANPKACEPAWDTSGDAIIF